MTRLHEQQEYANQGDADDWNDLPANGEGWDKPSTVDAELLAAAARVKRYNDEPLVSPDPWCDGYERSQQYGNDMAMLADYAVSVLIKEQS